jgi:hypothetical protein
MAGYTNQLSRREALKAAGVAAGAAAFASPVVVGVFSTQASAAGCDPSIDSDALDLLNGTPKNWNTNCQTKSSAGRPYPWGRYNAQRTTATLPGSAGQASIDFGNDGTDNYPVHCSFYTLSAPAGWLCSATFVTGDANSQDGCVPNGWTGPFTSEIGDCSIPQDGDTTDGVDFAPPPNSFPVPYCKDPDGNNSCCPAGQFLWLTAWSCCPPS